MKRKFSAFLLILMVASMLVACGSNATNTPVPQPTTAAPAPTTAAPVAATTAAPVATTAAAVATTAAPVAATAAATTTATGAVPSFPPISPVPSEGKKGGSITVAVYALSDDLYPNILSCCVTAPWARTSGLLWNGMITYNYFTLNWQLEMAKDLKVDSTGKEFTFTLRPDLKWSDGSPITPDDFVFTYDNIRKFDKDKPDIVYSKLNDVLQITSYKGDNAANTVTFTLNQTYYRDVALYMLDNAPVPKKVWEGKPFYDPSANSELRKPTVVSGPYTLESYDSKSQGVFKANPNWFKGKPNFDQITLKPTNPLVVAEALKNGQVDMAWEALIPSQYEELKKSDNLNIYEWKGVQDNLRYIAFNTTAEPFKDKALRVAIAHTVDRNEVIKLAEAGRATPAYVAFSESSPWYNKEITRYPLDLEKAKKILTDAGYKLDGGVLTKDSKPVKFTLSYSGVDITGKTMATYIQARLKSIGIDVSIEGKDPLAYLTSLVTKKYDAGVGIYGDLVFPDPDTSKTFFASTGIFNVAGFVTPRMDEIFLKLGPVETDLAKRKALYDEAQKILSDEVPSLALYTVNQYTAASKKIGGIVPSKGAFIYSNQAYVNWYLKS